MVKKLYTNGMGDYWFEDGKIVQSDVFEIIERENSFDDLVERGVF